MKAILTADSNVLIGSIATVVRAITEIALVHAQMVATLELVLRAVAAVCKARRAILFVRQIAAVPLTVTPEIGCDAVSACALECSVLELNFISELVLEISLSTKIKTACTLLAVYLRIICSFYVCENADILMGLSDHF